MICQVYHSYCLILASDEIEGLNIWIAKNKGRLGGDSKFPVTFKLFSKA